MRDSDALHSLQSALAPLINRLDEVDPWTMRPVTVVTVIGSRLGEDHHLTAQLLSALGNVRILALAQGPSRSSFSLVIEPDDTDHAVTSIHQLTLSSD